MATCLNRVVVGWSNFRAETTGDGDVTVPCGHTYAGEMRLCTACEAMLERQYPQGWRYYPGDTCRHGVYVGGCGADYMCGACEAGEE